MLTVTPTPEPEMITAKSCRCAPLNTKWTESLRRMGETVGRMAASSIRMTKGARRKG